MGCENCWNWMFKTNKETWSLIQVAWISVFSVGVEAFWVLPYLFSVYKGFGYLVIHYVVLLGLILPLLAVQWKLGDISNSGIVGVFSIFMPYLKGVGIASLLISFGYCIVYGFVIGLLLYYFFAIMIADASVWSSCAHEWNTDICNSSIGSTGVKPAEEYFWHKDVFKVKETWGRAVWNHILSVGLYFGMWPTIGRHTRRDDSLKHLPMLIFLIVYIGLPLAIAIIMATYFNTQPVPSNVFILIYSTMPQIFKDIDIPKFWGAVFYLAVIFFAVQSQAIRILSIVDNIVTGKENMIQSSLWTLLVTVSGLALTLPMMTDGGMYMVILFYYYFDALMWIIALLFMIVLVCIIVRMDAPGWCHKLSLSMVVIVTSLFIVVLLVFVFIYDYVDTNYLEETIVLRQNYNNNIARCKELLRTGWTDSIAHAACNFYEYPKWTIILGWLIAVAPIVVGLLFGGFHAYYGRNIQMNQKVTLLQQHITNGDYNDDVELVNDSERHHTKHPAHFNNVGLSTSGGIPQGHVSSRTTVVVGDRTKHVADGHQNSGHAVRNGRRNFDLPVPLPAVANVYRPSSEACQDDDDAVKIVENPTYEQSVFVADHGETRPISNDSLLLITSNNGEERQDDRVDNVEQNVTYEAFVIPDVHMEQSERTQNQDSKPSDFKSEEQNRDSILSDATTERLTNRDSKLSDSTFEQSSLHVAVIEDDDMPLPPLNLPSIESGNRDSGYSLPPPPPPELSDDASSIQDNENMEALEGFEGLDIL